MAETLKKLREVERDIGAQTEKEEEALMTGHVADPAVWALDKEKAAYIYFMTFIISLFITILLIFL